jgi:hypothetical protein
MDGLCHISESVKSIWDGQHCGVSQVITDKSIQDGQHSGWVDYNAWALKAMQPALIEIVCLSCGEIIISYKTTTSLLFLVYCW